MKTYTKEIQAPRLVIEPDINASSPREDDNLGFFITRERGYESPDKNGFWIRVVNQTASEARDQDSHMELIRAMASINEEEVLHIVPVYRYEHGNVLYRRGSATGYDFSNCGFYIVTKKSADRLGTPPELFDEVIDGELEDYTQYVNGDIWAFTLYDEKGNIEESSCGYYSIEEIREHLGEEWQNEDLESYIQY